MRAAAILILVILLFMPPMPIYAEGELKDIYDSLPNGVGELLPEAILMWRSKIPAFATLVGMIVGIFIIFA